MDGPYYDALDAERVATQKKIESLRAKLVEARLLVARVRDAHDREEWEEGETELEVMDTVCDALGNWGLDPGIPEHEPERRRLGLRVNTGEE